MRIRFSGHWLLCFLALAVMGTGMVFALREPLREWWAQRQRLNRASRESAHPIVAELANGAVRAGYPIEDLVARHPPTQLLKHDRYTTACYAEGNRLTYVVAHEGRLLWARQCGCGVHPCTFFEAWPDEGRAWSASFQRALVAADAK